MRPRRWEFLKAWRPGFYRPGMVVSYMLRPYQVVAVSGEWITLRRLSWQDRFLKEASQVIRRFGS